jgi:hypothetical protein
MMVIECNIQTRKQYRQERLKIRFFEDYYQRMLHEESRSVPYDGF